LVVSWSSLSYSLAAMRTTLLLTGFAAATVPCLAAVVRVQRTKSGAMAAWMLVCRFAGGMEPTQGNSILQNN
jgi:hypothetical protein